MARATPDLTGWGTSAVLATDLQALQSDVAGVHDLNAEPETGDVAVVDPHVCGAFHEDADPQLAPRPGQRIAAGRRQGRALEVGRGDRGGARARRIGCATCLEI